MWDPNMWPEHMWPEHMWYVELVTDDVKYIGPLCFHVMAMDFHGFDSIEIGTTIESAEVFLAVPSVLGRR